IRGCHEVTLAEESPEARGAMLTETLGRKSMKHEHCRQLYKAERQLGAAVEIIEQSYLDGRPGRGTVYHVAFRAEDGDEQMNMRQELTDRGYYVTEVKDRQYFHSVYFHEPGGVLFEIATDPPGFAIDEKEESLGSGLKLPP